MFDESLIYNRKKIITAKVVAVKSVMIIIIWKNVGKCYWSPAVAYDIHILRLSDDALMQGCTTQISWRANFFDISKGQS